jgi:hypothetical protein
MRTLAATVPLSLPSVSIAILRRSPLGILLGRSSCPTQKPHPQRRQSQQSSSSKRWRKEERLQELEKLVSIANPDSGSRIASRRLLDRYDADET